MPDTIDLSPHDRKVLKDIAQLLTALAEERASVGSISNQVALLITQQERLSGVMTSLLMRNY